MPISSFYLFIVLQRPQNYKKNVNQTPAPYIIMLFYNKTETIKNLNKHIALYMQKNKSNLPDFCKLPFTGCGGRTRTCDLQVMSLASYQLLHSAM